MRWTVATFALIACGDRPECKVTETGVTCGSCTVVTLADVDTTARSLVLTPTTAAWVESVGTTDQIVTVPIEGGVPALLATVQRIGGHYTLLRAHGTTLAWNQGPDITIQPAGDTPRVIAQSTAHFATTSFTLDATYAYVPMTLMNGAAELDAVALDGSGVAQRWLLPVLSVLPDTGGPLVANCGGGGVWRAPFGGEPIALSSGKLCAIGIAQASSFVVVDAFDFDCDGYGVVRADTGPLLLRPDHQQLGVGFVADDANVYFTTELGAWRISIDGGTPTLMIPGSVRGLALSASDLFALVNGALVRVAK